MGVPRRRPLIVVALLTALVLPAVGPAGAALVQVDVPTDSTAMDARITAEGDARWTITYRVELNTEDRRAAFSDLESDVAANESAYLDRFSDRMTRTVDRAESETGRAMAIENLSVSTETTGVPAEYGLLRYRFRWTNFATVAEDRVRAGDALAGLFLDDDTSLTIGWPAGYERASATPPPTTTGNHSLTWRGPRDFGAGEPRIVLEPADGGLPGLVLAPGVVLVLVAAAGALAWRRRGSSGTAEAGAATAPAGDGEAPQAAAPSDELLSNEERVLRLLEREGGRIKQQAIAERLEWTDAKTSQVIGDLRGADEVETFRIGRENVVTLPDHEL